jgi:hypothetical protein
MKSFEKVKIMTESRESEHSLSSPEPKETEMETRQTTPRELSPCQETLDNIEQK